MEDVIAKGKRLRLDIQVDGEMTGTLLQDYLVELHATGAELSKQGNSLEAKLLKSATECLVTMRKVYKKLTNERTEKKSARDGWICPKCRFEQDDAVAKCELCDVPRPEKVTPM